MDHGFWRVLFFLFAKSNLQRIVTVGIYGLLLRYHTGTSLDNGAGSLLSIRLKNAGHADFLTNNTFHCLYYLSPAPGVPVTVWSGIRPLFNFIKELQVFMLPVNRKPPTHHALI